MSKQIIAIVVSALILFFWQFVSWGLAGLHSDTQQYTADQAEILDYLGDKLEDGTYFLPTIPPGASADEMAKLQADAMGNPWAQITYRKSFEMNMGLNMVRGLAVNLLAAFLIVWILGRMTDPDMTTCLITALSVAAIGYLGVPYLDSVWFERSSLPYLLDAGVQWGLVGLWLGYFLNRKSS